MTKFKLIYTDQDNKTWLEYTVTTWASLVKFYDDGINVLEQVKNCGKYDGVEQWDSRTDCFDKSDF